VKNKKLIYILIPLVLVVWGNIFYQLFGSAGGDDDEGEIPTDQKEIAREVKKDTFTIVADYRDPFLGKQTTVNTVSNTSPDNSVKKHQADKDKNKKEKKEEPVVSNFKWPQLVYSGLVINKKSSDIVGLLSVNSKQFLVRKGQLIEGLTIGNISSDSITIVMGENIKTLIK